MLMRYARACGCAGILALGLALAGGACVSPDTFVRDNDAGTGAGVGGATQGSGGNGPSGNGGSSTGTAGSNGTGGHTTAGAGGTTGGVGGHTGSGGSIVGPTSNFMEDFESPGIADRWFWDSDTGSVLNPSSTSCGQWAVAADGATTNHMFSQAEACSGPSWAAAGNSGWTDMRLQARVMFPVGSTTSTRIMIGVRFASDRDQIYIEYTNDGKLKIRQKVAAGGAPSDTSNTTKVAVPAGQWVTVGLSVSGSTINAYLGADRTAPPVITATAVGLPAGGIAIGTTGGAASFDDVLVTPP